MSDPLRLLPRITLILLDGGYGLIDMGPGRVVMAKGSQAAFVILHDGPALAALPDLSKVGAADVLLLGGQGEARAALQALKPGFSAGRVRLHHLSDDGALWSSAGANTDVPEAVRTALSQDPIDEQAFAARMTPHIDVARARAEESLSFQKTFGARVPLATYALLGLIAVVFGLELLWGGSESTPTLVRMGALLRPRVMDGQWWRMLSCTFLHGGFMHIAFNGYVLYALGSSLERILGSERFVILYVLSGVGGSLASTYFLKEGLSVGASGAIWGLLAAQAVLAYRPQGLLPQSILPAVKRAAMINLGLNVLNSFRPQVDWAAHFGGGLVGALLLFAGVLTVGLPRLAAVTGAPPAVDQRPAWLRPVAALLAGLLLFGGGYAIFLGQPWTLMEDPTFASRSLGDSEFVMELPVSLPMAESRVADQGGTNVTVYGDLFDDPRLFEVVTQRFPEPLDEAAMPRELEGLKQALQGNLPKEAAQVGHTRVFEQEGRHYVILHVQMKSGLRLERAAVFTRQWLCRQDIITWPAYYVGVWQDVAERTIRTCGPRE